MSIHSDLIFSIKALDVRAVTKLLILKADADCRDADGISALHWSVHVKSSAILETLIEANASIDVLDQDGYSPLMLAIRDGEYELAFKLLQAKASVDLKGPDGRSSLHYAMSPGNIALVSQILEQATNYDAPDKAGYTPLHLAAMRGHCEIAKILLTKKVTLEARTTQDEQTPLHLAAAAGKVDVVKVLLAAGAKIDALDRRKRTPLNLANAQHQHLAAQFLENYNSTPKEYRDYVRLALQKLAEPAEVLYAQKAPYMDPMKREVGVYTSIFGSKRHYHFVTVGLAEMLNPKDPSKGYELSIRVPASDGDTQSPMWPVLFLYHLWRMTYEERRIFQEGDSIDFYYPLSQVACEQRFWKDLPTTSLNSAVFSLDPELSKVALPSGAVRCLQIIGLHPQELDAVYQWSTRAFLKVLRSYDEVGLTDLDRICLLEQSNYAKKIMAGIKKDGSSYEAIDIPNLMWSSSSDGIRVELPRSYAKRLRQGLQNRVVKNKALMFIGTSMHEQCVIHVDPVTKGKSSIESTAHGLRLKLTHADTDMFLSRLEKEPSAVTLAVPSAVRFEFFDEVQKVLN